MFDTDFSEISSFLWLNFVIGEKVDMLGHVTHSEPEITAAMHIQHILQNNEEIRMWFCSCEQGCLTFSMVLCVQTGSFSRF